jgi:hypothetical protein
VFDSDGIAAPRFPLWNAHAAGGRHDTFTRRAAIPNF